MFKSDFGSGGRGERFLLRLMAYGRRCSSLVEVQFLQTLAASLPSIAHA
jgi:hypothetical protein